MYFWYQDDFWFLAHLSQTIKWAFLIICYCCLCPCKLFTVVIDYISIFSKLLQHALSKKKIKSNLVFWWNCKSVIVLKSFIKISMHFITDDILMIFLVVVFCWICRGIWSLYGCRGIWSLYGETPEITCTSHCRYNQDCLQ